MAEVKRAPQQGRVLARSDATAVQTLAIGDHAIGTQFHCEFTPQTVATWSSIPGCVWTVWNGIWGRAPTRGWWRNPSRSCRSMASMTRRIYDNLMETTGLRK